MNLADLCLYSPASSLLPTTPNPQPQNHSVGHSFSQDILSLSSHSFISVHLHIAFSSNFQFRLYFLRRAFFYCDSVDLYQILLLIVLAPCPFPSQSSPPVLMKWVWDNCIKVESSDYLINSTRPGTMTVLFILVPPALRRISQQFLKNKATTKNTSEKG